MSLATTGPLLLTALAVLAPSHMKAEPAAAPQRRRLVLRSVSRPRAVDRLAPGLAGALPETCLRARIDGEALYFFDLDGDGEITPGGADGLGTEEAPFVVPLPLALLTEEAQYGIAFSASTLTLEEQEVDVAPELLAEAAHVNVLRQRGGRVPLVLDSPACRDAELHVSYLQGNGFLTGELSLSMHAEDPGREGYTPEGARAGREGLIGTSGSFRRDLEEWYAGAYHGVALLDPGVRTMGVAQRHGISLLYLCERSREVERPVANPCDGARDIPLEFACLGEVPNPVPGSRNGSGAGYPVSVLLPPELQRARLLAFELTDERGRPVEAHVSTPSDPASLQLPTNFGCAFLIPRTTLVGATRYTARLSLEGMPEPLEWSFTTTGSSRRGRR